MATPRTTVRQTKANETACHAAPVLNSQSVSRRHSYTKALDTRKQPIRGLWRRGDRLYARLTPTNPPNRMRHRIGGKPSGLPGVSSGSEPSHPTLLSGTACSDPSGIYRTIRITDLAGFIGVRRHVVKVLEHNSWRRYGRISEAVPATPYRKCESPYQRLGRTRGA